MQDQSAEFYSDMERLGMDYAALLESQKQEVSEDVIINVILTEFVKQPGWTSQIDRVDEWRGMIRPWVRRGIDRWTNATRL
jgi:hypothetical protein